LFRPPLIILYSGGGPELDNIRRPEVLLVAASFSFQKSDMLSKVMDELDNYLLVKLFDFYIVLQILVEFNFHLFFAVFIA